MNFNTIKNDEKIIFDLRSIYHRYGYGRYKMSKFEEYELYARNKDFLISDSIITFTDTNGKLMALKPDVTLSIVKNSRDASAYVQRLYYDENVYRVSEGTHAFRELRQMGLECIGDIDDYCIFEVLLLAAESLKCISENCVLNISSLDLISEIIAEVSAGDRKSIFACIGEKNVHELRRRCSAAGLDEEKSAMLVKLVEYYGSPKDVMPALRSLLQESKALHRMETILKAFEGCGLEGMLRVDFSVMGDENYYNGIVFRGFINGVPTAVLSGGQYDRLMKKMKRRSGAIGFAVYLDCLERLHGFSRGYDADVLLLYSDGEDIRGIRKAVEELNAAGSSVIALKRETDKVRCRKIARYENGEVKIIEDHA